MIYGKNELLGLFIILHRKTMENWEYGSKNLEKVLG